MRNMGAVPWWEERCPALIVLRFVHCNVARWPCLPTRGGRGGGEGEGMRWAYPALRFFSTVPSGTDRDGIRSATGIAAPSAIIGAMGSQTSGQNPENGVFAEIPFTFLCKPKPRGVTLPRAQGSLPERFDQTAQKLTIQS